MRKILRLVSNPLFLLVAKLISNSSNLILLLYWPYRLLEDERGVNFHNLTYMGVECIVLNKMKLCTYRNGMCA